LRLSSVSDLSYYGDGDGVGDEAGDNCTELSGVAVGEGFEGKGEAPAAELSFNECGTCINDSKESLAGVGVGEVAFSCAGLGCGFVGFASASVEGAVDRCSEMSVRFLFLDSAAAAASSNLPCTIIPDALLDTV
jgi:hypothetical protein